MAAFSPTDFVTSNHDHYRTSPSTVTRVYSDRFVTIISIGGGNYSDLNDNTRYWTPFDRLIQDFKRISRRIAERRAFCGKARERAAKGLDYKTPTGERGFWVAPETPAAAPPRGVGYPRWKDYARRRG